MFSAILLEHNDNYCVTIENLALASNQVFFLKILSRFPQAAELSRILNTSTPDLVFLDLSDWDSALAAAEDIREISPQTAIIGFGAGWESRKEVQCAAAGITELLVSPVTMKAFQQCLDRAIHKMRPAVQENLFAFLPAKAGSGCSTIALNTAGYLANFSDRDCASRKVLLIDGDLHSGVVSVLLDCKHPYSLSHALDNSAPLDYSQWTQYVAHTHNLDLLITPWRRIEPLPSWSNYYHLLDFAESRYDSILVDLSEVVNDATVEIVRRAKRVFVVSSPEPDALALAPHRCEDLLRRGISPEKIDIVLNRWQDGETAAANMGKRLGRPVSAVFGNDYVAVSKAAKAHQFVSSDTKLGKSFASFARKIAGVPDSSRSPWAFLRGLAPRSAAQPRA